MRLSEELVAIDLFSGSGGVTTGYKAAGVKVVLAVDIDPASRMTYAANHPDVKLLDRDLSEIGGAELLHEAALEPGQLDILTACAPCQPHSSLSAQHRKGREDEDPRNELVERVADFVETLKPKALVMENVPQLMYEARFDRLVQRLRGLGYGVWYAVVDAARFGVPQRRRRLVLIAIDGVHDRDVPWLSPEHPKLKGRLRARTVRSTFRLLARIPSSDELHRPRTTYPDLVAQRIAFVPKDGGSRASLPPHLELKCHRRLVDNLDATAAGNVYGRMAWNDVAPTLTTRCTTPACGRFLHPEENRAITLREAASLQTFPLNYLFKGGTIAVQRQVGNAVPPKLAHALALVVGSAIVDLRRERSGTITETLDVDA